MTKHDPMDYPSHRLEAARRLAPQCASAGDLMIRAGIRYDEAWKIWHGSIQLEGIRDANRRRLNNLD